MMLVCTRFPPPEFPSLVKPESAVPGGPEFYRLRKDFSKVSLGADTSTAAKSACDGERSAAKSKHLRLFLVISELAVTLPVS
jgi:hypothetical protein